METVGLATGMKLRSTYCLMKDVLPTSACQDEYLSHRAEWPWNSKEDAPSQDSAFIIPLNQSVKDSLSFQPLDPAEGVLSSAFLDVQKLISKTISYLSKVQCLVYGNLVLYAVKLNIFDWADNDCSSRPKGLHQLSFFLSFYDLRHLNSPFSDLIIVISLQKFLV